MSESDLVRAAIAVILASVPDAGVIHTYERYAQNQGEMRALYEHQGQIRGWHIRRVAISEDRLGDEGGRDEATLWRIVGYMALSDAAESELQMDRLIDAIRAAFRDNETLSGAVTTTWVDDASGLQMPDSGPVMFAGVLCHKAVLNLATRMICAPPSTHYY